MTPLTPVRIQLTTAGLDIQRLSHINLVRKYERSFKEGETLKLKLLFLSYKKLEWKFCSEGSN